jgi:hypothetical protein
MDLYLYVFCVGEECFYGYLGDNLSGRGSLKNGEIHALYIVLDEIRNMWNPGDSLTIITSSKTLMDYIAKDKERLIGLKVDVRWIPEYMNKARREAIRAYIESAVSKLSKTISSYVIRRISENILRVSVNGSSAIVFLSYSSGISMSCTCLEYSNMIVRRRLPLCMHIVAVANAFNNIPKLVDSISTLLVGGEG